MNKTCLSCRASLGCITKVAKMATNPFNGLAVDVLIGGIYNNYVCETPPGCPRVVIIYSRFRSREEAHILDE